MDYCEKCKNSVFRIHSLRKRQSSWCPRNLRVIYVIFFPNQFFVCWFYQKIIFKQLTINKSCRLQMLKFDQVIMLCICTICFPIGKKCLFQNNITQSRIWRFSNLIPLPFFDLGRNNKKKNRRNYFFGPSISLYSLSLRIQN